LICLGTILERRCNRQIKSALEAVVDIVLPLDLPESHFLAMLRSQGMEIFAVIIHNFNSRYPKSENLLKTLFIVSDVTIIDEGSLGTDSPEWVHLKTIQMPGEWLEQNLIIFAF
jgi:isoleucyl-tRNA synthetase